MTSMPTAHDQEPVFSISVVARLVGLHEQTIRMYERHGLVEPARTAGHTRRYSAADVERLRQVVRIVNELGVNLAGAQVVLQLLGQIEGLRADIEAERAAAATLRQQLDEARQVLLKSKDMMERLMKEVRRGQA